MSWTVDGLEFSNRKKITIQNANIDADLTNFPVFVDITADTDIGGISNADGFDHRFTASDGTTLLDFEREFFSISGGSATGGYWVETNVTTAAATDIYIYYRSADTADGADPTNVWNANFAMVHHLNDATTSTILDSTSNNYDGNKIGANEPIQATVKIGNGQSFDGSNDAIYTTAHPLASVARFTWSSWVKFDTLGVFSPVLAILNGTNYTDDIVLYYEGEGGTLNIQVDNGADGGGGVAFNSTALNYVEIVYDGTQSTNAAKLKLFISTAQQSLNFGTYTVPTTTGSMSGAIIQLGRYSTSNCTDMLLDEMRISTIVRTDAWRKFEYYNMANADNELTWGAEETPVAGYTSQVIMVS